MTSWRPGSSSCSRASTRASSRPRRPSCHELGLPRSPVLGRHFKIPDLYYELPVIELDDTLSYVPVYCHFTIHDIKPVVRPKTPPILKELRAEFQDMHLMKSPKPQSDHRCCSHNSHRHSTLSNRSH